MHLAKATTNEVRKCGLHPAPQLAGHGATGARESCNLVNPRYSNRLMSFWPLISEYCQPHLM